MLTLTSNLQAEALIKDGILAVDDDIEIAFDGFCIKADIKCRNIHSEDRQRNIEAGNINAWHIYTKYIEAGDINASHIYAKHIEAGNVDTRNIYAEYINTRDINAFRIYSKTMDVENINVSYIDAANIRAGNIKAKYIDARHINAWDIDAEDIKSWDIQAINIKALVIFYDTFCCAQHNIECKSITGRNKNAKHFCLDGNIIINGEKQ